MDKRNAPQRTLNKGSRGGNKCATVDVMAYWTLDVWGG